MATPTYVRTTVSKDGTKLRDEYSDGSFKNVRPNPAAIPAAPVAATAKSGPETRLAKAAAATGDVPLLIEPYGYGTDKSHHSKYDKAQWEKWAAETGFKPKGRTAKEQNLEFQKYLLEAPQFKDKVRAIHKELGMPYAGKPEDAFLGERWDKIMEKLTVPEEDKVIPPAAEKPKTEERKPIEQHTPIPYGENQNAPWWLQDTIKTFGAVGDMARLKKYLPWQATPQVRLPEATFYDPTRELAANTEMANMAMQNSAAFTNAQQQAAANTVAQGQMAKAAADTMGRYNNLNVTLANQLSQQNTGIMNQASQNKANLDTQLFDKYTIVNQRHVRDKAEARQNIRQSYIDAITNRANTANLNTLYPQYAVDPSSGGFAYFRPDPNKIDPTTRYDHYDALQKKAQQYSSNPEIQAKYFNIMLNKGIDPNDPNEDLDMINNRSYKNRGK